MQFIILVAALSAASAASINPKDVGTVNSNLKEVDVDNLPANVRLDNASLKSNSKSLMNAAADVTCPVNYPLYCEYGFCCTRSASGCCRNACCSSSNAFCGSDGHCYVYV